MILFLIEVLVKVLLGVIKILKFWGFWLFMKNGWVFNFVKVVDMMLCMSNI